VTVPLRLKLLRSAGPIATGDVELVVGVGVGVGVAVCVLWASATAGAAVKAVAMNTAPARKIAFISSRSLSDPPHHSPAASSANARRVPNIQALGG
jgi:hypothetical protein